jgi:hypothetical protein
MLYPGVRALNPIVLGAAVSQVVLPPWEDCAGAKYVAAYVDFVRTSGNGPLDVWLQTTLNAGQVRLAGGSNIGWFDIAHFQFTTATAHKMKAIIAKEQASDLTPAAFTLSGGAIVGLLGDRFRFAYSQTGSYGAQFQPWIVVS